MLGDLWHLELDHAHSFGAGRATKIVLSAPRPDSRAGASVWAMTKQIDWDASQTTRDVGMHVSMTAFGGLGSDGELLKTTVHRS